LRLFRSSQQVFAIGGRYSAQGSASCKRKFSFGSARIYELRSRDMMLSGMILAVVFLFSGVIAFTYLQKG
jgi:hypothetical protein